VSSVETKPASRPPPTVFLSYASEDRDAARSIGTAMAGHGLEVWLDESALGGGEAWDRKIRAQIRECDYFVPIVSAHTEARHEGYFRREWRLAVERTLDMADDHLFLLPVVIDDTDQIRSRVPEKFLAVQWLRVPGGQATQALEALCRRIVAGQADAVPPTPPPSVRPSAETRSAAGTGAPYPAFPVEEPGRRAQFLLQALGWALRAGWLSFKRLPRWIRILAYLWLGGTLLSHGCSGTHRDSADLSPAKAKAILQAAHDLSNRTDHGASSAAGTD
jgi:TIR domain